ncbi:lipopolysaccharide assembly protein LapA domain-containing protein [Lishizhenia tianjinensis]|nr:LapA family protein [Lishizhenia tianjinensis]
MLLLGVVVLVFIFQNLDEVTLTFVTYQFKVPLSLILLLIGVFGYLFARVTDIASFSKKNKEIKSLQQEIKNLKESQIKNN